MKHRYLVLIAILLCLSMLAAAQATPAKKVFAYKYFIDDLPNGMRVITVPTDMPNLVAIYTVVQAGSRNEVEPGKSGFAHLFEHLMFRGSKNFTSEQRDLVLKKAGASSNAYTTDDRTVYHEVFSKEDLDKILQLEADHFRWLSYPEDKFKTETGAVLGEYNKNSANPFSKMYEVLRETAYKKHTYSHTTMGYIKDIEAMPNEYDYSIEFYKRYYRPEYTTMIMVGDLDHAKALASVKKYFGDWERGSYKADIPKEPPQTAPQTAHIDWPNPTLPLIAVAFRGPAYSDTDKDYAALDLMSQIAFGENSDLYQKLVLKEQKVDMIDGGLDAHIDPEMFAVMARVKNVKDMDYVRDQILATYKRYSEELIPQEKLDATRSRMRYSLAMRMNSAEAIAGTLAPYVGLRRTPETLNTLFELADTITPEDIRNVCKKYFVENNRTIVTLATKQGNGAKEGGR